MPLNQTEIFAEFEGDRWFGRNQQALKDFDPDNDSPLRILALYGVKPRAVLEIGAANGVRLAEIAHRHGARTTAVELSQDAIRDGQAKFPMVDFICGPAHAIPLAAAFDLVIVNFVLHWVDRSLLLRTIAEVDRLLGDGGFLVIGDFSPVNFLEVPYHHLTDESVSTFKQNYAAPFLASGIYHAVGLLTANHSAKGLGAAVGECERTGVWLLQKKLTAHYAPGGRPR
jgi:SAM-dependent methyltransferase